MYRGETAQVIPTPPGVVKAFEKETEVKKQEEKGQERGAKEDKKGEEKAGGEKEDEKEKEEEAPVIGTGTETTQADISKITENVTETTQRETSTNTESASNTIAQGKTAGKVLGFTTLLTGAYGTSAGGRAWNVPAMKGPMYLSHNANQVTGGIETFIAYEAGHENDDSFKMTIQGQDVGKSDVVVKYLDWGFGTDIHVEDSVFSYFSTGGSYTDSNGHEYLQWGVWEDTAPTDMGVIGSHVGDKFYAATSKIWFVEGDRTHPDYISYLQQQNTIYNYSGEAKGVFADSTNPAGGGLDAKELSGSFSCQIDFGSRQVSNFNINASDNINNIRIDMTGGSGTLTSDGGFKISNFSGTMGPTANRTNLVNEATGAGGGVFGAKADGVGGDWQAHDGANYWATGEFHGKR
ncbi:MAG: hypothetical protein ABII26_00820 [Pseudomonadota bacterium]